MELSSWLRMAEARLGAAGIESPKLEASVLAAHVLGVDRSWIFAHPEHEFNELAGEHLLQRRERQEPLAYILGYREFFGRRFIVSKAVLIPRQDTEILVEQAIELLPRHGVVLDVGTGSGCIAITLALVRPDLAVLATDISAEALEVARQNREIHSARVLLFRSDLLSSIRPHSLDGVVTNPPYIGLSEELPEEVNSYEPATALYGGPEGHELLQEIARQGRDVLKVGGYLLTEIGYQQEHLVAQRFAAAGWNTPTLHRDLGGRPRVLIYK